MLHCYFIKMKFLKDKNSNATYNFSLVWPIIIKQMKGTLKKLLIKILFDKKLLIFYFQISYIPYICLANQVSFWEEMLMYWDLSNLRCLKLLLHKNSILSFLEHLESYIWIEEIWMYFSSNRNTSITFL